MATTPSGVWLLITTPEALRVSAVRLGLFGSWSVISRFPVICVRPYGGMGSTGKAGLCGCAGIKRKPDGLDARRHAGLMVRSTSLRPEVTVGGHRGP